ncbi:hypothetical protein FACS1894105_06350 [Clostridia bacterium]|nr:hypothetical protein FACS1894105_06350 [Clostridia bacterium]GHV10895.1 hypothetical protein FACS1894219_01140 [Clostridia bacterium]
MLGAFETAAITFVLNYSAYLAEIYRGGIQSIDKGQYEAAHALGLSGFTTMFRVILPQTFRRVLPPISNEAITLIKDTALISVIGAYELLKYTKDAVNRTANPFPYFIAALFYLFFTLLLTMLSKKLEKIFGKHEE